PVAQGHSFLFGHLLYLKSYLDRIPKDAHYQYAFGEIGTEHFPGTGAYYIDPWPMTRFTLVIISPKKVHKSDRQIHEIAPSQTCYQDFFLPITSGPTIIDVNEAAWKPWRSLFNKGFHSDYIQSLVPRVIEEMLVYADTIRAAAKRAIWSY
ncbi:hypothetical protein DM02DRAFT_521270, partial [Periconia macrospinosa]